MKLYHKLKGDTEPSCSYEKIVSNRSSLRKWSDVDAAKRRLCHSEHLTVGYSAISIADKGVPIMHVHNVPTQKLAIGMAALAGYTDALGFLVLGRFFVSFMSGNSTLFAVGIIHNPLKLVAATPLAVILLFVIGVMLGRTVRHFSSARPSASVLFFMAACLTIAAATAATEMTLIAVSMMAIAMGAANNVFVREGEVSIGVTYMTGTLVKLGQRLAGQLLGEPDNQWRPYLRLWLGLLSGASLGAAAHAWQGQHAIWLAAIFCIILAIAALKNDHINLNIDLD